MRTIPMGVAPAMLHREGTSARVPIMIVDGLPTVEIAINGHGPLRFVVDTGQPFAVSISHQALEDLQLDKVGETTMSDPSGRNPRTMSIFRARMIHLGDLRFKDVDISEAPMIRPDKSGVAGTIGMALFDKLTLTIDYGRGSLSTSASPLPTADEKSVLSYTTDEMGMIVLPVRIGRSTYQAHLDTGNGRAGLFMPTGTVGELPTKGAPKNVGVARTISQQIVIQAMDLAAPVAIGTAQLPITEVAYPSVAPIGNIGSLGLQGLAITIDSRNHRIQISPR